MTYIQSRPIVAAGPLLTALGHETAFAFAAGASLVDPGTGGCIYAWTLVQVPAGSSKTTANIANATSLTGATLDAWDRPGTYVFLLTVTDSSLRTNTARVSVRVGTSEGYLVVARVRWAQLANRDLKVEGDGAKVFTDQGTINVTLVGVAGTTSCAIVNGTGLVAVGANPTSCYWNHAGISTVFPRSGRVGTYALLMDGTLSDVSAGYEACAIFHKNTASGKQVYVQWGQDLAGKNVTLYTQHGTASSAIAANAIYKAGLVIDDISVRAYHAEGADWDSPPMIDSLTPKFTGAVKQNQLPNAAPHFDGALDYFYNYLITSTNGGGAVTNVIRDTWLLWKP